MFKPNGKTANSEYESVTVDLKTVEAAAVETVDATTLRQ
jgi:hypothetical protein